MKLWEKGEPLDELFERFTIGKDRELDLDLAYYDAIGSVAHVKMLGKIGLLEKGEAERLIHVLEEIGSEAASGKFKIEEGVEDCHSQIELLLTQKLGDLGKKVHTGRSRNDQVLTALKLYSKAEMRQIVQKVKVFFDILQAKSESTKNALMPGYTHLQVAMPSSFGLWFGAYAESLVDDLLVLRSAYRMADKSPLGSGAGYGSSFPLDREYAASAMQFSGLNENVIYAQMTRGKLEKTTAFAIGSIANTLARFAMDVCLYAGQDYGFLYLDTTYTTGSSIMPHKHNPDGFELVRAKCNKLQALPYELNLIMNNLPSGYHRDYQVLKESYLPAFATIKDCLDIVAAMTKGITINEEVIHDKKYDLLFTVEEVNKLVMQGMPFRDAYKEVANKIDSGSYIPNKKLDYSHTGSIGNLANDKIKSAFERVYSEFH